MASELTLAANSCGPIRRKRTAECASRHCPQRVASESGIGCNNPVLQLRHRQAQRSQPRRRLRDRKYLRLQARGPPHANAASSLNAPPPGMSRSQASSPGFVTIRGTNPKAGSNLKRIRKWLSPIPVTKFFRGFLTRRDCLGDSGGDPYFSLTGNPTGVLRTKSPENPESRVAPAIPPSVTVPPPLVSSGMPPSGSVGGPSDPVVLPGPAGDSKTLRAAGGTATELPIDDHVSRAPQALPSKVADLGDEDLALAQRYLGNKAGPASSTSAAHLLWAAVEKGNVTAEITLADLYARGDGVTRSCDQARVLLRAAAARGSSEASQELAQIIQ